MKVSPRLLTQNSFLLPSSIQSSPTNIAAEGDQQAKPPENQEPKDSFTIQERRELDFWQGRLRTKLGVLETPPAGERKLDMDEVQGYVSDVLDKVAGKELSESAMELRVEVFSGDIPQAALDDSMSREKRWHSIYGEDKEWPIRRFLGAPSGTSGQPIYRLAIDVGMLKALDSEDELAFVLAHQAEILLNHHEEDPENKERLGPSRQSFVEPRDMQASADKAAVERMVKGGYNPRAAFSAISKLFALNPIEYPESDLERGLTAAAHGHEAEGLRVGLIQSEVENFIRKGDPTTTQPQKPIPGSVKLNARPQYVKPVEDLVAFKVDHRALVDQLTGDETPEWMFNPNVAPREFSRIKGAGGDSIDKEAALVDVAEHLQRQHDKTPQQKVDGFLRLLLALKSSVFSEKPFSDEGLRKINKIMSKFGKDWNPQTFFDSLSSKRTNQSQHFTFVEYVVFKQNFQEMIGGALPGLAEAVPMAYIKRNWDEPKYELLPGLVAKNHKEDRESWPLGPGIDRTILKQLSEFDPVPLTRQNGLAGFSKATAMANRLYHLDEPTKEMKQKLMVAGTRLREVAAESREQRARLRLAPPYSEPERMNYFFDVLGKTEVWADFTPEFERDLAIQLRDFATISSQQPGFIDTTGSAKAYSHDFERRFAAQVGNSDEAMTHFVRHLPPSRRVRAHSPRRAWLGEAARTLAAGDYLSQIANPDRTQHSKKISDSLIKAYQLQPEDLPDTTTASLRALNERVQNEEFKPKREDYQSDDEFRAARNRYLNARRELRIAFKPIAPVESRTVLGKMVLLGHDQELSKSLTENMTLESFNTLIGGAEEAKERFKITKEISGVNDEEDVRADAGGFLVDAFLAVQNQVEDLDQWYDLADRTISFSDGGLESRVGAERALGNNLYKRLQGKPVDTLKEWMGKDRPLELMSPEHGSDILLECLGEACRPGVSPDALAKEVERLNTNFKLMDEHPVTYLEFRDKVAEKALLQPSTVNTVFPESNEITDSNVVYRNQARSLSGLIAMARERSPQEQIDTVEYLMGRLDDMPEYLEAASEDQSFAPLRESLETTRQDLLESDSSTRVLIANSFLSGPSGVLRTEEGKEAVISHFLKNIKEENRELSDKIARGVLYSHGDADTLAVAYILGQHPEEPKEGQEKGQLNEASILNRLFDAYGVPGIKMKQYLAFTREFQDFKDVFEDAQDSALPLNYYQVLKLVQNRFGDEWPKDLKIDRVLGSGSVNVAVRYRNEETGKREVVSLGRQDIEESTKYDFDRFNKLIDYMTQTPEDKEKYGYILGLLDLINDSVALEFQKEQAMGVQQHAYQTYRHEINGWNIKSIDAYRVENLGLFMEEAKGKTARKIFKQDEELYKEAMDAMAAAEFGVLRGVDFNGNWRPKPLFANPDFHDGQVLIDEETKSVTILDFGQAVPISNEDRVGGLDLLTIIGKADSAKNAAKRLNNRYFDGEDVMTIADMEPLLEREDRMDCFIHMLSLLNRKGAKVPISSIHWVLGINRQMSLATKIGDPIDSSIRNMVLNHKAGLPLATYNASHDGWSGPNLHEEPGPSSSPD